MHQNGDVAPWDDLAPGGQYERLTSLEEFREALTTLAPDPAILGPGEGDGAEFPDGAIHNGRESLRRLAEHYQFEDQGGLLKACSDYHEAVLCFEFMAEHIAATRAAQPATTPGASEGLRQALVAVVGLFDNDGFLSCAGCGCQS